MGVLGREGDLRVHTLEVRKVCSGETPAIRGSNFWVRVPLGSAKIFEGVESEHMDDRYIKSFNSIYLARSHPL